MENRKSKIFVKNYNSIVWSTSKFN